MLFEYQDFDVLLNCEGDILRLVNTFSEIHEECFWFSAFVQGTRNRLYVKISPIVIRLYIDGVLTLREIFYLRTDQPYYIGNDTHNFSSSLNSVICDMIDHITCVDDYYPQIEDSLKPMGAYQHAMDRYNAFHSY